MTADRSSRFVILHHVCPADSARPSHYDLMIEHEGVLLTWALAEPPRLGVPQRAERLADHRLAYLDFEGEISGGRGTVTRWDRGDCEVTHVSASEVVSRLNGHLIRGNLQATLTNSSGWQLQFELD